MSARDHIRSFPSLCALLAAAGTAVLMPPAARAADRAVPPAQESRQPSVMPPGSLRDPIVPAGAAEPLSSPGNAGSAADEEMPPAGRGEMFSEGQIRYCLAQRVRIDAVRPLLNRYDHEEIQRFNEQVADLNSRCSSYRYSGSALQDARAWLESARPRIEQAARDAHRAAAATAARSTGQGSGGAKGAPSPAQRSARADDRKQAAVATPPAAQKAPPGRKEAAVEPEAQASSRRQPELPAPPAPPPPPEVAAAPASVRTQPEAAQSTPAAPQVTQPRTPAPQVAAARRDADGAAATDAADAKPRTQSIPDAAAAEAMPPKPEAQSAVAPVSEAQPAAAALPPQPEGPSPAAPVAEKQPSAPAAQESASSLPETGARTAAATASDPAGSGQDGPLARLTKEVHAVGSMVLERPADGAAGDATAQLEVRYAAGGYIRSIVIAQSSGSADLDQQALALARTLRLPNAPQELQGQELAVRFPVVFRSAR
jgi:TonB family protein